MFRGVQSNDLTIDFGAWMMFAAPLSLVLMVVIWLYLTRIAFRINALSEPDLSTSTLNSPRRPWTRQEIVVGMIFFIAVSRWIGRRYIVDSTIVTKVCLRFDHCDCYSPRITRRRPLMDIADRSWNGLIQRGRHGIF